MVQRVHRRAKILFVVIIDEFYRHFRVRRRVKLIALPQQFLFQFLVILNDAVVNRHHISVIAAVGMGVFHGGLPVGSPAGMADAAAAFHGLAAVGLFLQHPQPSFGFDNLCLPVSVPDRQSGRIISPVLQLRQALQKNGGRLPVSCVTYNSAHIMYTPLSSLKSPEQKAPVSIYLTAKYRDYEKKIIFHVPVLLMVLL